MIHLSNTVVQVIFTATAQIYMESGQANHDLQRIFPDAFYDPLTFAVVAPACQNFLLTISFIKLSILEN